MAETLVRFTEAITGRDGRAYVATALGTRGSDGLWHGWLEFSDGTTSVRTTQESEQPNRDDLRYWAQGLTYVYLEGALERALHPGVDRVVASPAAATEPRVRPTAVLDPYVVYRQGENVLRQQLLALSRDQLNAVIEQFNLGPSVPAAPRGMLGYADAVDRIILRIRSAAAPSVSTSLPDSELRRSE
jgi:hypothetical protein